jgi:hypothetical protein
MLSAMVWRRHGYSPVFRGASNVTLLGILWGGTGSQFVYSPIANIEQELGALTTR